MKKLLSASLAILCITTAIATPALAKSRKPSGWYSAISAGMAWYPDAGVEVVGFGNDELSSDSGWMASTALGYAPSNKLWILKDPRFELEYSYHANDAEQLANIVINGETTVHTLMANMFLDFYNQTRLTPYVGGGLGYAWLTTSNNADEAQENMFAWQLMAGVGFEPAAFPKHSFSLGYRYLGALEAEHPAGNTVITQEYSNHSIELGARWHF